MRILLDTHALLWFMFDDAKLSKRASRVIGDASNQKIVSVASLWEITIKVQLKKLSLGLKTSEFIERIATQELSKNRQFLSPREEGSLVEPTQAWPPTRLA